MLEQMAKNDIHWIFNLQTAEQFTTKKAREYAITPEPKCFKSSS